MPCSAQPLLVFPDSSKSKQWLVTKRVQWQQNLTKLKESSVCVVLSWARLTALSQHMLRMLHAPCSMTESITILHLLLYTFKACSGSLTHAFCNTFSLFSLSHPCIVLHNQGLTATSLAGSIKSSIFNINNIKEERINQSIKHTPPQSA